ncbi:unnamed protein product [Caenorhabditis bovis]|uniref:NADP-dependent oxidoreductase domain-containing protein n=1 Tax=Caenorhabditis bovis TaxID=2654633 RepID=A0A8S1EF64_9PELO|nr:unnamed protein product [Caenorhabditis bovis]
MTVGGPVIKLSNGVEMPAVGLGTWQSAPAEVKNAVKVAVKAGYRLIDTASVYQNEESIGDAIQELIKEGVVKREELFITTKAWCHELPPNKIEGALRESLKKLKLEYVDLYLAHMPVAFTDNMSTPLNDVTVEQIWPGFEKVYELGLAKSIGVSNWNNEQIARALKKATIPIHNSQVELHLYFPQHEHAEFCANNGIVVTSYATLGSPGRVNFTLPTGQKLDWAPAPADLEDSNVLALGKKYNKTPAQVLLRYALDRGFAIIPKSVNENRIKENFKLFDFKLTQDDIKLLESSKQNVRLFLQDFAVGHNEDPFANERK